VKGEILASTGMKRKAPVRRFTFKETRDGFGTLGGVAVANEENLFSHTKATACKKRVRKKILGRFSIIILELFMIHRWIVLNPSIK
jgi:hypothetical protein